jgi:hypothetical protein
MKNYTLTNRDISENFRDVELYLMINNFKSAFAYWAISQNPFGSKGVEKAVNAYEKFLKRTFRKKDEVVKMNYEEIQDFVSEDTFFSIPEIAELNQTKDDFICLGALSRNVFYMILREQITQPL